MDSSIVQEMCRFAVNGADCDVMSQSVPVHGAQSAEIFEYQAAFRSKTLTIEKI